MSKFNILSRVKKAVAFGLCLCIMVTLFSGCQKEGEGIQGNPTPGKKVEYTIEVANQAGVGISHVTIKVFDDNGNLESAGKTNELGILQFTAMSDAKLEAVVSGLSNAYTIKDKYPLTGQTTTIIPEIRAMTDADMDTARYELTSPVMDFSVMAADGTTYTLFEELQEKKAVVLNFWFLKCDPCRMEFPYIQQAYEKYSDDITLLAMNPLDGTNDEILAYAQDLGLTFPMASCDSRWGSVMKVSAYPTTVVIDRYGYIVFIHRGMVDDAVGLENIFAYVTSDDYQQQFFRMFEEIPSV